jgi:hypothetical protein
LSEEHPDEFGTKQQSIVQRLLKALRKKTAEKLLDQEPLDATAIIPMPGAVDGSGYRGPTASIIECASKSASRN